MAAASRGIALGPIPGEPDRLVMLGHDGRPRATARLPSDRPRRALRANEFEVVFPPGGINAELPATAGGRLTRARR